MIHFFPTFSKDARNSPFANSLKKVGVAHEIFPGKVSLRYPSRLGLLFFGWPKIFWFALVSAFRSLVLARPHPETVVVGSHIEAIVFAIFRFVLFRNNLTIVLLGFILTNRESAWLNHLRFVYFRLVFQTVDKVICHSSLEQIRYSNLFKKSHAIFIFIPYGLHINGRNNRDDFVNSKSISHPYILTAGRSGRDYATLLTAIEPLEIQLHVVCDNEKTLANLHHSQRVTVLKSCYDTEYVNELRNALFVVIPLGVNDISAGQMVLIQAMAFAKPTIVTRTATIEEYVSDGVQSLLVAQGDVIGLRKSIKTLLSDKKLADHLSTNALTSFENRFCMQAYVQNLVKCIAT